MNKYALGTIVGTALIGLAKSKLGSGTRLKLKKKMQFFYSVRIDFSGVDELEDWQNWQEEDYFYEKFFNEHSDIFSPALKDINGHCMIEEADDDFILFDIVVSGVLTDEDGIEENIHDWMDGYARDFAWHFGQYLVNEFGIDIDDYTVIDQNYEEDFTVVNADTGEKYIKPESIIPKLRKR